MIYGNYLNESYNNTYGELYVIENDISHIIDGILDESNQYINSLYEADLTGGFKDIVKKVTDTIILIVDKFKAFLETSIDKIKSLYIKFLNKIDKKAEMKHNVKIYNYHKLKAVDNTINDNITKAEDAERKLEMNKYDKDFISVVNNITDEIKSVDFGIQRTGEDGKIDDTKLTVKKYANAGQAIDELKSVLDIAIIGKQKVLHKLPEVKAIAKKGQVSFNSINENSKAAQTCYINFYNALLHFLNKALNTYRAIDEMMIHDIKVIHKACHGSIGKSISDYMSIFNAWSRTIGKFPKNMEASRDFQNQEDYEEFSKWQKTIYQTEDYEEYKKAFNNIANFFEEDAKEIIIRTVEVKDNSKFGKCVMKYAKGLAKVKLPDHTHLIHATAADLPGYIIGAFRSRKNGMFFYPERRAFFTVERQVDANSGGMNGMSVEKYTTTESYKYVYLDPSCPTFGDRCVMIMTDDKIPVEKVDAYKNECFEEFDDSEYVIESVEGGFDLDKLYAEIEESLEEQSLHKIWHSASHSQRIKKYYNRHLSDEEYNEVKEYLEAIKNSTNYNEYIVPFRKFCRFCSILPEHIIITKYSLHKHENGDHSLKVEYSHNNKKIQLPDGTKLFHVSKVPGIQALKPVYKGKSERGYLYDRSRVYLTIYDKMPKFLADYKLSDKIYKYMVKTSITEVYVDPLVWHYCQGAVYVETSTSIPVTQVSFDIKNAIKGLKDSIAAKL